MSNTKKVTRIIGKEYCTLEVEVRVREDGFKSLSICGTAGRVLTPAKARKTALQYWESFFEDQPEERHAMNERTGKNFRSAKSAAKFVVQTDGEYHGLDASMEQDNQVFVAESCGQIREELLRFFPEVEPYLKWHLNDMHAGCEHQEALGWGRGRDVAVSKDNITDAQRAELERLMLAQAEKHRVKVLRELLENMQTSDYALKMIFKEIEPNKTMTTYDKEVLQQVANSHTSLLRADARKVYDQIQTVVAKNNPPKAIESAIYKDSINAPCPTCGYRYGTQWLRRELPVDVVTWAESLPNGSVEVVRKRTHEQRTCM